MDIVMSIVMCIIFGVIDSRPAAVLGLDLDLGLVR